MKKIYAYLFVSLVELVAFSAGSKRNLTTKNSNNTILLSNNFQEQNGEKENSQSTSINPWKKIMQKYNIPENHEAGIYVDLALDVTASGTSYRMPGGKCPVFGKEITILNSKKSFLDPVATTGQNVKEGGFAINDNTNKMSPVTIDTIKENFKGHAPYAGLNDVSLCAKHANNFKLASDDKSAYRHPAVFDLDSKTCYLLAVAMQNNEGSRYCDNANDNGFFCFKPNKQDRSKNYVYLTKNIRDDWETNCPRKNLNQVQFGLWVDGTCEEITPKKTVTANSLKECNRAVFQESASDQPQMYETKETDYDKIINAFKSANLNKLYEVLIPPGSTGSDNVKSKGVGLNWGNYNTVKKQCELLDVVPTCLIDNMDYIATTALSHPEEIEASVFPCNIYEDILNRRANYNNADIALLANSDNNDANGSGSNGGSTSKNNVRIFISQNPKLLNCPCEPTRVEKSTCNFYICSCVKKKLVKTENNEIISANDIDEQYKEETGLIKKKTKGDEDASSTNSDKGTPKNNKKILIIILACLVIILLMCIPIIYFLRKKKRAEVGEPINETDSFGKEHPREDELLDPEASFWGERRVTHTTPVYREKPYY